MIAISILHLEVEVVGTSSLMPIQLGVVVAQGVDYSGLHVVMGDYAVAHIALGTRMLTPPHSIIVDRP